MAALVSFGSTVVAPRAAAASLTVSGNASFAAAVGGTALKLLSVSGTTSLNAGTVTTNAAGAGIQTYTGAVTLLSDTTLSASAGTGTAALVSFGATVAAASAGADPDLHRRRHLGQRHRPHRQRRHGHGGARLLRQHRGRPPRRRGEPDSHRQRLLRRGSGRHGPEGPVGQRHDEPERGNGHDQR